MKQGSDIVIKCHGCSEALTYSVATEMIGILVIQHYMTHNTVNKYFWKKQS